MNSQNQTDCCILDFTHVSCAEHKKPDCDKNGCGPVPPTIGFSYAHGPADALQFNNMECVNVLDNVGKETVYEQFFISHCTAVILIGDQILTYHLILTVNRTLRVLCCTMNLIAKVESLLIRGTLLVAICICQVTAAS